MSMKWQEQDHPRDNDGKFTDKGAGTPKKIEYRQNTPYWRIMEDEFRKDLPDRIKLPDETLPHSVGAKWANYEIDMGDGTFATFQEGSKLQDKEVFAGKGCRRIIDDEDRLLRQYGGKRGQWKKVKARVIVVSNGKTYTENIHWYEEDSVGKVEFKIKRL